MTLSAVISTGLLYLGLAVVAMSALGIAVLDDAIDRLHVVTPATMLGVPAIAAAVVVRAGLSAEGSAALLLGVVTLVSSPLVSHALARSIFVRRQSETSGPNGTPNDQPIPT